VRELREAEAEAEAETARKVKKAKRAKEGRVQARSLALGKTRQETTLEVNKPRTTAQPLQTRFTGLAFWLLASWDSLLRYRGCAKSVFERALDSIQSWKD
jgi:hypothetical protein